MAVGSRSAITRRCLDARTDRGHRTRRPADVFAVRGGGGAGVVRFMRVLLRKRSHPSQSVERIPEPARS